jgi:hypothetical protein
MVFSGAVNRQNYRTQSPSHKVFCFFRKAAEIKEKTKKGEPARILDVANRICDTNINSKLLRFEVMSYSFFKKHV